MIIELESVLEGGIEESEEVKFLFKIRTASTCRHLVPFGKLAIHDHQGLPGTTSSNPRPVWQQVEEKMHSSSSLTSKVRGVVGLDAYLCV